MTVLEHLVVRKQHVKIDASKDENTTKMDCKATRKDKIKNIYYLEY